MKTVTHLFSGLALLTMAVPVAAAELPPYVYAEARAKAEAVLVIAVNEVERLPRGVLQGDCTMKGVVEAVERGDAHTVGQTVSITVPCIDDDWESMPGPFPGYDENQLERVASARVWVTGTTLVLRGLDALD